MAFLPWHQSQWTRLTGYVGKGRLAHAMLMTGPSATGKLTFARHFANFLLCEQPANQQPCGQCHDCKLYAAGNHPDLVLLTPEEGSKAIKVDEIRAFVADASLTPQIASRRVTLIYPAEAMNASAANSLLKTLEEPNPENHILLISHAPWELPATIRSRCQEIVFPMPATKTSVDWLRTQQQRDDWEQLLDCVQGAPLRALAFAEQQGAEVYQAHKQRFAALLTGKLNIVDAGQAWSQDESGLISDWLYRWTLDLARGVQTSPSSMQDDELAVWLKDLIPRLDSGKLFALMDQFIMLQRGIRTRNLNTQMQYEALAHKFTEITG